MGVIPGGKSYTQQLREIIDQEELEQRRAYERENSARHPFRTLGNDEMETLRAHFEEPSK